MQKRKLGNLGPEVSLVGLGDHILSAAASICKRSRLVVDKAFDPGVTLIGIADAYGTNGGSKKFWEISSGRGCSRNCAGDASSACRWMMPASVALRVHRDATSCSRSTVSGGLNLVWMRQILNDIEAGRVSDELQRRGIPSGQRLRVVVESIAAEEPSLTAINAAGGAFDWLAEEPDLYSDADLIERFRS